MHAFLANDDATVAVLTGRGGMYGSMYFTQRAERAADWLKSSGLRSLSIVNPFEREKRKRYVLDGGFPGGPLSEALPEDLAIKYGSPLGLE
ncbi:MAG: hypothetical protein JWN45_2757 [Acidobacteriaceae bacterium]|nr:hypothetical protein [Acidobacteriaceae bacterium]